jgi:hypothetical protein
MPKTLGRLLKEGAGADYVAGIRILKLILRAHGELRAGPDQRLGEKNHSRSTRLQSSHNL